jgi:hypothetical protein
MDEPRELDATEKARYRNRYIAFLDLLGFRWIVEESRRDTNAFRVAEQALRVADHERSFAEARHSPEASVGDDALLVYMFSDTVLITSPPTESGLSDLIGRVARLSLGLIHNFVFLRGAVVRGDIFEHGHIVFGPGLVHAYDLESTVAWYPRVILTEEIVKRAGAIPYQPRGRNPMSLRERFRRDADGQWFIDWLRHYHAIREPGTHGFPTDSPVDFEAVKSVVTWSLQEFRERPRVLAKTNWFANYFNSTLIEGRTLNILGRHRELTGIAIEGPL